MPFAKHHRVVACGLEQFGRCLLRSVEDIENWCAVEVGVFSREHRRPAWGANRIANKCIVEAHAVAPELVEVRRGVDLGSVRRNRVRSVIIRHDEEDVWSLRSGLGSGGQ